MAALTFGVELEAAFFYTRKYDEVDKVTEGLGPVVDMTPDGFKRRNPRTARCKQMMQVERDEDMQRFVTWAIHDFVEELPKDCRGEIIPATGNDLQDSYREWKVEIDISIKVDEKDHDGLEYTGLEVISPAMYASENAFREVKAVTDMLRMRFRTAVPPSCGFHVHVGQGLELFPLRTLQKLAAVCWAGDIYFQQMHPVSRRFNHHCLGPRVQSNLGHGEKAEDYHTPNDDFSVSTLKRLLLTIVALRWEAGAWGSTTTGKLSPGDKELISHGKSRRAKIGGFTRELPRNQHAVMPSEKELDVVDRPAYSVVVPDEPWEPLQGHNIMTGTTELFRCLNYDAVASLMSVGERGAYSFANYLARNRRIPESSSKTIEFRQAAGSLDGHWVATFARICVGMTRFAQHAPLPKVWELVYACHLGENLKLDYDVLDLLLDLGLPTEAKAVQSRLMEGAHIAEIIQPFLSDEPCLGCDHLEELILTDREKNDLPFELIEQERLLDYWGRCGQW